MACPNPFDVLRLKSEDLGTHLYARASYRDAWLNLIPREDYGQGVGLAKSTFTVGRSEPTSEEEDWPLIELTAGGGQLTTNSCSQTWNDTTVGYKERVYGPEQFALRGPLVCQDDLVLHWQSEQFWNMYFQALEKRNVKSIVNRLANIYMNFAPATLVDASLDWTDPLHFTSQSMTTIVPPQAVDLSDLGDPTGVTCELSQYHLDATAVELIEQGATDPDTNGWMVLGPDGPIFPLLIGQEASARISVNNSDFRTDLRDTYAGLPDSNPIFQRLGASLVIKNFRHVVTAFPPRWDYANGDFVRVPAFTMSSSADDASKGQVGIVNPLWKTAEYEGAIVLSPWVFHEEILRPVGNFGGMQWQPQNYLGEWQFVTGNDALINTDDSCAGVSDPLKTLGRHFGRYKHAAKPIFPEYGRLFIFKRCRGSLPCDNCSS